MEIRDPVHGSINMSPEEVAVLDSAEFQRLRAVKQLGFSEFSYPGATHNRYIHSIGVCHLAGLAFDQVFQKFIFSTAQVRHRLRQSFRLAALLHDIGHGPLSHTTEEVMPSLSQLKIKVYNQKNSVKTQIPLITEKTDRRANHEDYTIKYITDSPLTAILQKEFPDMTPYHICCLIDKSLQNADDFFLDQGFDFRPILSQLVSSELDCDRMDYLERDSYFCGTNYGKGDTSWLLANLTAHMKDNKFYLGISRRALYTFDDFLISRHHMYLMVYFHHKSIIYEEMLFRYMTGADCSFFLPADINEYTKHTDYKLYEHLAQSNNEWAQRIALRKPYKVLMELHNNEGSQRPEQMKKLIESHGIDVIHASSQARLSKYHQTTSDDRAYQIYVVDPYDRWDKPAPIDESTEIFQRYEGTRIIDRLYIDPNKYDKAEKILLSTKI